MKPRQGLLFALLLSLLPLRADVFEYVQAPDTCYAWSVGASNLPGIVNLNLTSQKWQGGEWKHTVSVFRPAVAKYPDLCVMLITGGSFGGQRELALGSLLANSLGMTFAVLWDIPNQPLWGMKEDDLIAHTFVQTIETGDSSWPLLFPMTKSAVRAMDALQAWSKQATGTEFKRFVTTGASKRGWTTWFTGVVDPRVVAIVPIVYDNLNLAAQMPHQLELWGHYSPQIDDYTRRGLQAKLETPEGRKLAAMVDPYTYRDRLAMPKLIVNGGNDAYWTIDALSLYRDALPGETCQIVVPNAGHGVNDLQRLVGAIGGFLRLIGPNQPRPELTWEFGTKDGAAAVTVTAPAAKSVAVWRAAGTNCQFDQAKWETTPLTAADGAWSGTVALPAEQDLAVFAEVTFEVEGLPMPLSTPVQLYRVKDR